MVCGADRCACCSLCIRSGRGHHLEPPSRARHVVRQLSYPIGGTAGTAAARPQALIGGHMIAALCGWAVGSLVGDGVTGVAVAIGAAAVLMQVTGTLHPPAAVSGYLMLNQPEHWTWLLFPILCGAILLSVLGHLARRLVPATPVELCRLRAAGTGRSI